MVGNPLTVKMIESTINKSIREIKNNPEKGLANLANLANRFASNSFQQDLIKSLQTNDYILPFLVNNVNHPTIRTFILNLAYNSLSYGAKRIKRYKQTYNEDISWAMIVDFMKNPDNKLNNNAINTLIRQGNEKGIYTYMFFTDDIDNFSDVSRQNPDSAFILFVPPTAITNENIRAIKPCYNTFFSILYEPDDLEAYTRATTLLHDNKCLFGSYRYYKDEDVGDILSNKWLGEMSATISPFWFLIESEDCCPEHASLVHEYIYNSKTNTASPIFLIDLYEDIAEIDKQLS